MTAAAIRVKFPTFPHLSTCIDDKGEEIMHVSATPHWHTRQPVLRSNQSRDQFPHWPQDLRPWIDGSTTSGSVREAKQVATIIQLYIITGLRLCLAISVWTFFQCEFRRFTKSACMRSSTPRGRNHPLDSRDINQHTFNTGQCTNQPRNRRFLWCFKHKPLMTSAGGIYK